MSTSLSEAALAGREIVSTEEVRRMTLPMRADYFGSSYTAIDNQRSKFNNTIN